MTPNPIQITQRREDRRRGMRRSLHRPAIQTRDRLVAHVLRLLVSVGKAKKIGVNVRKLRNFICECSARHNENPYHNWHHAADVTHTAAWLSRRPVIGSLLQPQEVFWLLVAAVVHDLAHPGHSNQWEVSRQSELAMRHGHESVLEKASIEITFSLLEDPECCFTDQMPEERSFQGKNLVRDLVLATDVVHHDAIVGRLKSAVQVFEAERGIETDPFRLILLQALLKAADMGNATKPFVQAAFWAERAMQEGWAESVVAQDPSFGSMRPTRANRLSMLSRAQIAFIQEQALGFFGLLGAIDPELNGLVHLLHDNLLQYQRQLELAHRALDIPQRKEAPSLRALKKATG